MNRPMETPPTGTPSSWLRLAYSKAQELRAAFGDHFWSKGISRRDSTFLGELEAKAQNLERLIYQAMQPTEKAQVSSLKSGHENSQGLELKPTRYVLGFLFRDNGTSVVLIRKDKPRWQAGRLNGIGGKIEAGETELAAMVREFREETGVDTSESGWRQYCEMSGDAFTVYCFTARDSYAWEKAATETSERVEKHSPDHLIGQECVSNLHWLMELALDDNGGNGFYATVRYSRPFRMPAVA